MLSKLTIYKPPANKKRPSRLIVSNRNMIQLIEIKGRDMWRCTKASVCSQTKANEGWDRKRKCWVAMSAMFCSSAHPHTLLSLSNKGSTHFQAYISIHFCGFLAMAKWSGGLFNLFSCSIFFSQDFFLSAILIKLMWRQECPWATV